MSEYNELNYSKITNDLWRFRRFSAGGNDNLQDFDVPGHFYFKILFGFDNNDGDANGLLGLQNIDFSSDKPIDMDNSPIKQSMAKGLSDIRDIDGALDTQKPYADTAFNFLLLNNELERANYLKQFIKLLSEVNTSSPWYWKSISGLDTLLERKMFGKEFKIEEERPKISIKCLTDAYDSRIGTILDLYRAICYSYSQKKVILPANLRKFDMTIYIFHTIVGNMHDIESPRMLNGKKHPAGTDSELFNKTGEFKSDTYIGYGAPDNKYYTGSKIIELRNCEIDISSIKSGYGEMSNETGFGQEYTIDIFCDDAYETRYNEFVMRNIGDYISTDLMGIGKYSYQSEGGNVIGSIADIDTHSNRYAFATREEPKKTERPLASKTNLLDMAKGQLDQFGEDVSRLGPNVVGATMNSVLKPAESFIKSKMLGNIYGFSLSNASNYISNPVGSIQGDVTKIVNSISPSEKLSTRKKIPGTPTFDQKKAQLLSKTNMARNIFNSI